MNFSLSELSKALVDQQNLLFVSESNFITLALQWK